MRLLNKLRAIPPYLRQAVEDQGARYRKLAQLNVRPVSDLADPFGRLECEFTTPEPNIFTFSVGMYQLTNIFLHIETGLCFQQTSPADWPIAIRESGSQEYQELSVRQSRFRSAQQINHALTPEMHLKQQAFVFNIHRPGNYFHFVIDSLPRLIGILSLIEEPIIILHSHAVDNHVLQYFDLLEQTYQCQFQCFPSSRTGHIKITSPTIFIEDLARRLTYSSKYHRSTWSLLEHDPQLGSLGLKPSDLTPTHKTSIPFLSKKFDFPISKSWKHKVTGETYKNGLSRYRYSPSSLSLLNAWGQQVSSQAPLKDWSKIFVTRRPQSTMKRFIANERELRDRLIGFRFVDFSDFRRK